MADAKWAADERKLSSASDDISYGRFKSAQNTVDRHLKKHPKSQPALVLRMVLLEKTGASDKEVVAAFASVRATGELTARSAWWVGNTLRSIQRLDLCLEMWASSWEANPDRVEMGEQTFLYAASAWNTDMMMSSSRKMFNKLKTPIWARVAAWAEYASKAPQPSPEMPHAEAAPAKAMMIAKLLINTSGKESSTSDIYWLRLQILISSGDLTEALKIAQEQGKAGTLAMMWYRMEAVPVILSRLESGVKEGWKTEWEWVSDKIKEDSQAQRNFAYYRYLIQVAAALKEDTSDRTFAMLRELDETIGVKERSPLLAILELGLKMSNGESKVPDSWLKDVEIYWNRWGSKQPVITELEGAIAGNAEEKRKILAMLEDKRTVSHSDLQAFSEIVNAETFCLRHVGPDWIPSPDDVKRLWALYLSGLQYGKNLPTTDVQPADFIGLSAVHLLLLQWSKDKSTEAPLLSALSCLQYILSKSPSSAHAKFLLIRVARLAGAPSMISDTIFGSGGYAEVQLDTLLHPLVERGSGEAHIKAMPAEWDGQLAKAQQMYRRTASDIPEYIKQALQNESYAKVPGMRSFQAKMATSLPGAITRIERSRFNLLSGRLPGPKEISAMKKDLQVARAGGLSDTRDWDLMPTIGGDVPHLKDLTQLDGEIDGKWVVSWGSVLLAVVAFSNGEATALDDISLEGLLPAEKSALMCLSKILRQAEASSEPTLEGASTMSLATGFFDDLIALASTSNQSSGSRWSRIYPVSLLVEVSGILAIISKRLEALSQPVGTGNSKKKADPRFVALFSTVREIKNDLKTKSAEVGEKLSVLEEADRAINWDDVAASLIEDREFVNDIGKKIVNARGGVVRNLQAVLGGKKL